EDRDSDFCFSLTTPNPRYTYANGTLQPSNPPTLQPSNPPPPPPRPYLHPPPPNPPPPPQHPPRSSLCPRACADPAAAASLPADPHTGARRTDPRWRRRWPPRA